MLAPYLKEVLYAVMRECDAKGHVFKVAKGHVTFEEQTEEVHRLRRIRKVSAKGLIDALPAVPPEAGFSLHNYGLAAVLSPARKGDSPSFDELAKVATKWGLEFVRSGGGASATVAVPVKKLYKASREAVILGKWKTHILKVGEDCGVRDVQTDVGQLWPIDIRRKN